MHDYLQHRVEQADQYEGFNLLLFRLHRSGGVWHDPEIGYLSNKPKSALTDIYASGKARATAADIQCTTCGLSNSPLAMPWPKVVDGQARMADSLHEWSEKQEDEDALVSRMIAILQCVEGDLASVATNASAGKPPRPIILICPTPRVSSRCW